MQSCAQCGSTTEELKWCSRCRAVKYCSKECQRLHWKASHRRTCVHPIDAREQERSDQMDAWRLQPPRIGCPWNNPQYPHECRWCTGGGADQYSTYGCPEVCDFCMSCCHEDCVAVQKQLVKEHGEYSPQAKHHLHCGEACPRP
jgi:hypothetical protein